MNEKNIDILATLYPELFGHSSAHKYEDICPKSPTEVQKQPVVSTSDGPDIKLMSELVFYQSDEE